MNNSSDDDEINYRVVTKDFSENLRHGNMICGINFGYAEADERIETIFPIDGVETLSFFSDQSKNNYRFRNRILDWFSLWGIPLVRIAGEEGAFERSFFQSNWLNSQTKSVRSDGKIDQNILVEDSNANGFLEMLSLRQPKCIFFFGSMLIEALNDVRIRMQVEVILGSRPGKAQSFQADLPNYVGRRFALRIQHWPNATVICLPHPASQGLSNEYIGAFKPQIAAALPVDWLRR